MSLHRANIFFFLFVLVCMYLCACTPPHTQHMHVCEHVGSMPTHVCTCRSYGPTVRVLSHYSPLYLRGRVLHHFLRNGYQEAPGVPLSLTSQGWSYRCILLFLACGCWESKLRLSCWCSQHCTHWDLSYATLTLLKYPYQVKDVCPHWAHPPPVQ